MSPQTQSQTLFVYDDACSAVVEQLHAVSHNRAAGTVTFQLAHGGYSTWKVEDPRDVAAQLVACQAGCANMRVVRYDPRAVCPVGG